MTQTPEYIVELLSPEKHPGFGSSSIFSMINSGSAPTSIPLFQPDHLPRTKSMSSELLKHLVKYNRSIGNPISSKVQDQLNKGASLVITGQQPGLLLGPLYTFWKLISAVTMARDLTEAGQNTVAAFWIASEDHDILEVNRVTLGTERFVANPSFEKVRGKMPPVGRVSLVDHRDDLLAFLRTHLQSKLHADWVIEIVANADYANYGTFFASLLGSLFAGFDLLVVDALDINQWTSPVLANIMEKFDFVQAAMTTGSDKLRKHGFIPPLNDVLLFEISSQEKFSRNKVQCTENQMILDGVKYDFKAAAQIIRDNPGRFSSGAALRPVVQDVALPVSVMVCGPSEMLYLWQIDSIYRVMNVERSRLQPRICATVLPPQTPRWLAGAGGWDAIFSEHVEANTRIEEDDLGELLDRSEALIELLEGVNELDPKLKQRAADSIAHQIKKVVTHTRQKRLTLKDGRGRHRRLVLEALMPAGKPQERSMCLFEVLAQWGPGWLAAIRDGLTPWDTAHRLITMRSRQED